MLSNVSDVETFSPHLLKWLGHAREAACVPRSEQAQVRPISKTRVVLVTQRKCLPVSVAGLQQAWLSSPPHDFYRLASRMQPATSAGLHRSAMKLLNLAVLGLLAMAVSAQYEYDYSYGYDGFYDSGTQGCCWHHADPPLCRSHPGLWLSHSLCTAHAMLVHAGSMQPEFDMRLAVQTSPTARRLAVAALEPAPAPRARPPLAPATAMAATTTSMDTTVCVWHCSARGMAVARGTCMQPRWLASWSHLGVNAAWLQVTRIRATTSTMGEVAVSCKHLAALGAR